MLITFSSLRSLRGRKVKPFNLFTRPLIYVILGLLILLTDISPLVLVAVILGSILGILLGDRFGKGSQVFLDQGEIFYKRSPIILAIWLSSYIARVLMYPYLGSSLLYVVSIALDFLLFMSGFMLLGESIYVFREYSKLKRAYS
nr:hypothetical protein [Sulfuracidifex tepidarius]